jgi:regulator of sirC expression with transglutaminase-like and TPR domain
VPIPSPARLLFAELAGGPDHEIDLVRAALLVAVEDDPDAAVEPTLAQFDFLMSSMPGDLSPLPPRPQVEALASHLHGTLGFRGASDDEYYSPLNSLLTQVLTRRVGIPITLALVYMEVARRLGIPLVPIGLPGHVVVRDARDGDVYLDPFQGAVLGEEACLVSVLGPEVAAQLPRALLAPLGPRPFLLRLLNNLKGAYLRADPPNPARALAASERMLLLYPDAASELRDRGLLHLQLGERIAALWDLERYLGREPEAADADMVRRHVRVLYTQLGRLN